MASCVLLELPEPVSGLILVEYLTLRDVAVLDSAYCCCSDRDQFTAVAYSKTNVFTDCPNVKRSKDKLSWILSRGVQLHTVDYTSILSHDALRGELLRVIGANVRVVDLKWDWHNRINLSDVLNDLSLLCPNVRSVSVGSEDGMHFCLTSDGFSRALVAWHQLITLTVLNTRSIFSSLSNTLRHCHQLKHLILHDGSLRLPVEVAVPTLQSLDTTCVVSDAVMSAIGERCSQLVTLKVFWMNPTSTALRITDLGVRAVLQGCPLLRETDVEYAAGISTELRVELARRRNLNAFLAYTWADMSEQLTAKVLQVSPALKAFACLHCAWITDFVLVACATHCPLLKYVYLYHTNVRDEGVISLVKGCPELEIVILSGTKITMQAVRALAESSHKLGSLQVPPKLKGEVWPRFVAKYVEIRFC
jgi:hypothetical protein